MAIIPQTINTPSTRAASFTPNIQAIVNKAKIAKNSIGIKAKSLTQRSIAKVDLALRKVIDNVQKNTCETLKLAQNLGLSDIKFDLSIIGELNDALLFLEERHNQLPHNHEAKQMRQDMIEISALLDVNVNILLNKIENTL